MVIFYFLAAVFLDLILQSQAAGIRAVEDTRFERREAPILPTSATLSTRSKASDVVHDKIFIPTIVTMGVLAIIALICCFKIVMGSSGNQVPRGSNWAVPSHAAADRVYNTDGSKDGTGTERNGASLGHRMSKSPRKSPPPFLPGASNTLSQPLGAEQNPYNSQPGSQYPMSAMSPAQGHWAPDPARISILSSAQSATEVGSDAAAPSKAKPYSPVGGYGFSHQPVAPAEFGTQRSQPSTIGSQNYNPYDGIDPTYEGNQGGGGYQGASHSQADYSKGGQYAQRQRAP